MMMVMGREAAMLTLGELMRRVREAAGVGLSEVARAAGVDKGHLSHVEHGRDRPSWNLVAYYEESFDGDGQLWSAYVEVCTAPRARVHSRAPGEPPRYPLPGDRSEFVDDVTIPDGTVMPPDFIFEKVWRLRNAGTVPWTRRLLARDGAASGHGIPHSPSRVSIPDTAPGELVDIAVPLRAHPIPGTAQVRWKMVDEDGYEFFPDRYRYGILLTIVVREGAPPPSVDRLA